jgi:prepilin-type N-terminal cleavage/methylation domain-containing protein
MKRSKGFTLVELLTVIAIIAILTAILFPVFSRAKVAAKRQVDSSNLASLHQALQLYRTDQGGYPPLLLQVAEYDPNAGMDRPVDTLKHAYLFSSRVKDIDAFKSTLNDFGKTFEVTACWPSSSQNPAQAYNQNTVVTYQQIGINPVTLNGDLPTAPARFYAWDSVDVQQVKGPGGPACNDPTLPRFELRYTLFWTVLGQAGGGPNDNPRQLGYNDPPDNTIVTWDSAFRRYDGAGVPFHGHDELVLFLNGSVKPSDSQLVYQQSYAFGQ